MRISWSALLRWEKCHRMDGLLRAGATQTKTNGRNFLTGNIVDTAMREWLDQDAPQPGQLVALAEKKFEYWTTNGEEIKWKGSEASDRAKVLADAREALSRLEPWLLEHVVPFQYQPEARGWATVQVPGADGQLVEVELLYAIDILVRLPDGTFWVIDLKTTRNESYIRGSTLAQLPYYSLVISAAFGIPLDQISKVSFLTPLCSQMLTSVSPDQEDYRFLIQRITAYTQGALAQDWAMREKKDSVCDWECSVKSSCPRGKMPELSGDTGRVDFMQVANAWKG